MPEYGVLLSYPDEDKPNKVSIINNGKVEFEAVGKMKVRASTIKQRNDHDSA